MFYRKGNLDIFQKKSIGRKFTDRSKEENVQIIFYLGHDLRQEHMESFKIYFENKIK
jgi:hypothetical protein